MKKSALKPGQLVRSASRRGKQSSKFHFDFTVERLFPGQKEGNTYYIKWTRGVKVAQTKSVVVEREHKGGTKTGGGMPFNDKMSLLVTLYRTDNRFDEKDSKLALVSVSPTGAERTVAKMHFDLAQFAGANASASKVFKLNEKASIKCSVDSRVVKGKTKAQGDAASMMSGMTGLSDGEDPEEDFGDLDCGNLDDVPDDMGMVDDPSFGGSFPVKRRSSGSSNGKFAVIGKRRTAAEEEGKNSGKASFGRKPSNGADDAKGGPSSFGKKSWNSAASGGGGESSGGGAAAAAEVKALRKELEVVTEEKERLVMDVKRAQDKRKRIEANHESEMAALRATKGSGSEEATPEKVRLLTNDLDAVREERDKFRMEAGELRATAKEVEALRRKEKELSREVDRLTVSSAGGDTVVEERLSVLQGEKEGAEKKLQAHQAHSAKVKETYVRLTGMYNGVRDENIELQAKVDDLEAKAASGGGGDSGGGASHQELADTKNDLRNCRKDLGDTQKDLASTRKDLEESRKELRQTQQAVRDVEDSKSALERDSRQMKSQLGSLQSRLDVSVKDLNAAREEVDNVAAQLSETTAERDSLMAKSGGQKEQRSVDEGKLAEATKARGASERELARTRQKVSELERVVADKTDDVEYEKQEKNKAREERDALRESARALERRTSQVSQTADAVHSLKRQLSTHKMREADQSAMIKDLREEMDRIQEEKDALAKKMREMPPPVEPMDAEGTEDNASVLEELVMAKLSLATLEDEMLNLEFKTKQQRKGEKAIQEKLAAHASSLEVRLGEASDELSKLRMNSPPSPSYS